MLKNGEPLLSRQNRCVRKLAVTALAGLMALFLFLPSMVQAGSPTVTPGSVVGWGWDYNGQANPPAGSDYVSVAACNVHGLAVKSDGSLVGWGGNNEGQTNCPAGNDYTAVAGGSWYSLALKSDGSIVGWGYNKEGQATPPAGNDYTAVSAGDGHGLALKSDGSIVGWGANDEGQSNCPAGNDYTAVVAGGRHSLALKSDGSIVGWGWNFYGEATPPAGNDYTAVAAGGEHGLALKSDGSIVGWGWNDYGQATPPAGNDYTAVAAGSYHSLALKSDGSIVGWGFNIEGQTNCPAGNDYTAVSAGDNYSLALGVPPPCYYFAEGCTRDGFAEWLCIQNPGAGDITVNAEYMLSGAGWIEQTYTVPATSRTSVNVNSEVGPGQDVSVKLTSEDEFYAERPMYFSYKQGVPGYSWTGGHCATGAPSPNSDWYFAEGTTRAGFEEWICIQNPFEADVTVGLDYVSAGAYTQHKDYNIPAKSRISVFVNGDVGPNQDVSTYVHCDSPIVAERPMYFNYKDKWTGGHVIMGTDSPKTAWYFAEGSTQPGFEEWLAVQNASDTNAIITCHFLKSDGTQQVEIYTVGANSRWTLDVSQAVGVGVDSAIVIESDQPVVAERPMYFSYKEDTPGYGWTGGHDVVGAKEVKKNWFFAEGCTHDWADEYICVANPGAESAHVIFTFMLKSGAPVEHSIDIDPHQRATVKVADIVGRGQDVSTEVLSDKPVVAERPMYFNYNGVWSGGHDVVGF